MVSILAGDDAYPGGRCEYAFISRPLLALLRKKNPLICLSREGAGIAIFCCHA
jgi:hypothetical protein